MPSSVPTILQTILNRAQIDPTQCNISGNILTHQPSSSKYFARTVSSKGIPQMRGEAAGLVAMAQTSSDLVPKLIGYQVSDNDKEAGMITQYFDFSSSFYSSGSGSLSSEEKQRQLARKIAEMHSIPNQSSSKNNTPSSDENRDDQMPDDLEKDAHWTGKYGFNIPTHCGITEQDNTWEDSWEVFFRDRRLGDLVRRIGDGQINKEWERMKGRTIPLLLNSFHPPPQPVILHGDLWSGNKGFDGTTSQMKIFDPAVYYGHNEADLGIMHMFGGFTNDFFDEYHKIHPRSGPYYEQRQKLYELYHHLNHTLMFGGGYKSGTLGIMRSLNTWAESVHD